VAAGIARLAREIEIEEEETHAAAPTGRAAVVLTQRMAQPPPATTIHRLLWASPQLLATRTVRRQLKGTVVIDESSMLTTEMLAALIRSGENGFLRVVLVGDHNQLPPVGAGQPFHDIIALHQSGAFNRTGVDIAAIWLQRNYRQQGTAGAALAQAAAQVLAGQAPTPIQPWISVDTVTTEAQAIAAAAHWATQHAGQCSQVLTPLRETAEALSQAIRQACPGSPEKVVQTVNRVLTINGQRLLLANGLIGTVTARWPNPGVILVEFPDLDAQAGAPIQVCYTDTLELEGALVEIAGNRYTAFHISDLLPAEAVTIHRGQGSEWEHVCLVLINDRHPERRRLLYTATTRPRETLHIITLPDVADKIAQGPPAPRVSVLLDLAERMLADMQKPAAPGLKPAV
jgi:ATP-dependent exoDNAse (exonuclease V) alpha subunit